MVPTLALGIPGSTTTAIILAGLMMQGVRPGPHLFTEQPSCSTRCSRSMLLANLLYLVLGLGFAKVFARISLIPTPFLWPAVFVLSVIGAYAPNQAMAEVWVAIAFGVIGFFCGATASRPRRWSSGWCSARWSRKRSSSRC